MNSSRKATALSLLVNMIGPWLGYEFLRSREWTEVQSLLAVSVVPLVWSLVVLVRQRTWDLMACISGASMVLSLLACLGTNDIRALQVRDSYITLIFGLVFTGSVLVGRPFILEVALSQATPENKPFLQARAATAEGRAYFVTLTLVWGLVTIGEFLLKLWMIWHFPIAFVLAVSPWVLNAVVLAAVGWTWWYTRRARARFAPLELSLEGAYAADTAG